MWCPDRKGGAAHAINDARMRTQHLPGPPVIALCEQMQIEFAQQQTEAIGVIDQVGLARVGRAPINDEPIGKGTLGCCHRAGKDVVVHACETTARLAVQVDDLNAARIRHQAGQLKDTGQQLVQAEHRERVDMRPRRKGIERARIGQARSPYSISHLAVSAQVSLGRVAAHHALGVEVAGHFRDCLPHHPDPALSILMVQRQHDILELVVEIIFDRLAERLIGQ